MPHRRAVFAAVVAVLVLGKDSQAQSAVPEWPLGERPILTLGSALGGGPDEFSGIAAVLRGREGEIVVIDGASVKAFSATGSHIRTSGRSGAGPGEFRTIKSARLCDTDSVAVYDPASMRLTNYSMDGKYRSVTDLRALGLRVPAFDFWCTGRGELVFLQRSTEPPTGIGPRRPIVDVSLWSADGGLRNIARVPSGERYFDDGNDFPRPLGKPTAVAVDGEGVVIGTGESGYLLTWGRDGSIGDSIPLPHSPSTISDEDVRLYIDEQLDRRRNVRNYAALERMYREMEYPTHFPNHGEVFVDAVGLVWVEEYPRPTARERRWFVLRRSGAHVATVRVPRDFDLRHADERTVTGVWRDADGVEFVRVYDLGRRLP